MQGLPTTEEIDWILAQLGELIARVGPDPFLCAPILLPSSRCFPDRWRPDVEGVRTQIRRLLAYGGLAHMNADVSLFERPDRSDPQIWTGPGIRREGVRRGPAALYLGTEGEVSRFAVDTEQLNRPEDMMGVLAHEVTHAWRREHGLMLEERETEELLTDLSTIYLGFGVLTANASYGFRQEGGTSGVYSWTQTGHSRMGYLPTQAMCYALALQVAAREDDVEQIRRHLRPNQAGFFAAALEVLDIESAVARLGLPPREAWQEIREAEPGPLGSRLLPAHRAIVEFADRIHAEAQSDRANLVAPRPCALDLWRCRRHGLAEWGGQESGGFVVSMALFEVPEVAFQMLVASSFGPQGEDVVLGLMPDKAAGSRDSLLRTLRALISRDPSSPLFSRPPTYALRASDSVLRDTDVRDLLWSALPASGRASSGKAQDWWRVVSDPDRIQGEVMTLARMWRQQSAPPP